MSDDFDWREFDATPLLPEDWQQQVMRVAAANATPHTIVPTSVTSREADSSLKLPVLTVGGAIIHDALPWLFGLYLREFLAIAQTCVAEPVFAASGLRYSVNLNVQRGDMRYEAHIDSNPLEGLLYVTDHPPGTGGELIVCRRPNVVGVEEISRDCVTIYPKAGRLIFFDARRHSHFVAPLEDRADTRIVVAMNYYTPSCPESARPADLDRHLGLS